MNLFFSEVITPPAHLPITTSDAALAAAVVEEIERGVLWRGIVRQTRRILIDGPLPILELEPVVSITSLTRWTEADPAEVVDPDSYTLVSRDPSGALIAPLPGHSFPAPMRPFGSFALTYDCGWTVTDTSNTVPASVQYMVERAVAFRKGSGLAGFSIGSLTMKRSAEYASARLPASILSIASSWAYRPGLIVGRA